MPNSKRTPHFVVLFLLGACALAGGTALAAPVKGKVTGHDKLIPDVYADAAKPESHRYSWREPSPTVRTEFRVLSANPSREICIAALATSNANPHDPILVKVTGGRTVPATIVVAPNTRLSFKNADPFPHRLYQVNEPKWSANTMATGAQRDWAAPGPGRYEIRDEYFPSVRMWVVVEPQVVDFVYPDKDGAFSMNLPPGEYTLKAYFAGKQVGAPAGIFVREGGADLKEPINVGGESK
jgi:hypothetical protein